VGGWGGGFGVWGGWFGMGGFVGGGGFVGFGLWGPPVALSPALLRTVARSFLMHEAGAARLLRAVFCIFLSLWSSLDCVFNGSQFCSIIRLRPFRPA